MSAPHHPKDDVAEVREAIDEARWNGYTSGADSADAALTRLLDEAVSLLDDARCDLRDPALRRTWGARRKALRAARDA